MIFSMKGTVSMKRHSVYIPIFGLFLLLSSCKGTATLATPTVSLLPTATATILPTATPTPIPLITINQKTDCHSGPGNDYETIATFEAGQQVEVVGRDNVQLFWIVKTSDDKDCWIDSKSVTFLAGEIIILPEFTPPPVPTPAPPVAPSDLNIIAECEPIYEKLLERYAAQPKIAGSIIRYTLTWKDNANNEMGYQLLKNSESFMLLPPDTSSYIDTISFPSATINYSITFGLVAYNEAGQSRILEMTIYKACNFLH